LSVRSKNTEIGPGREIKTKRTTTAASLCALFN
jgi:hypothetical protein